MSRRHHGGRSHRPNGHARGAAPLASTQAWPVHAPPPGPPAPPAPQPDLQAERPAPEHDHVATEHAPDPIAMPPTDRSLQPRERQDGAPGGSPAGPSSSAGCTAPQLRRFIKSRPYVPMHELRRRFGINGSEDDVTLVEVDGFSKKNGLCCGAGGAQMWMEEQNKDRVNVKRTLQLVQTEARTIATACPFCLIMLRDGTTDLDRTDLAVRDVAELLADATGAFQRDMGSPANEEPPQS